MGFDTSIVRQGLLNTEGVELIPAGAEKTTFNIDNEYVLQTAQPDENYRINKAVQMLSMLEKSDIPVPELAMDASQETVPYFVTVFQEDSRPVNDISEWNPETINDVVFQAGKHLGSLHKWFSWDGQYGELREGPNDLKVDGHDSWKDYVRNEGEQYIEDISALDGVDRWVLKVAEDALDECVESVPEYPENRILHGDYKPSNMIIDDNEIKAVIDWDNALAGDPNFDYTAAEEDWVNHFHYKERDVVRDMFSSGYEAGGSQTPDRQKKEAYSFLSALKATASLSDRDQATNEMVQVMGQYMERNAEKLLM